MRHAAGRSSPLNSRIACLPASWLSTLASTNATRKVRGDAGKGERVLLLRFLPTPRTCRFKAVNDSRSTQQRRDLRRRAIDIFAGLREILSDCLFGGRI